MLEIMQSTRARCMSARETQQRPIVEAVKWVRKIMKNLWKKKQADGENLRRNVGTWSCKKEFEIFRTSLSVRFSLKFYNFVSLKQQ